MYVRVFFLTVAVIALMTCKSRRVQSALQETGGNVNAADYVKMCADAGVPIPDRPLTDRRFWNPGLQSAEVPHFGELATDAVLHVHAAADQAGCTHLLGTQPRSDGKLRKAGLICWSSQGRACFWEGSDIPATEDLGSDAMILTLNERAHPFAKDGMKVSCTRCHRGDNVTVGHGPAGQVDPIFNNLSNVTFTKAIAPSFWPGNEPGNPEHQCAGSCHKIAQPDPFYCMTALGMLEAGMMSGSELGFTTPPQQPSAETCKPFIKFAAACAQAQSVEFSTINLGGCGRYLNANSPPTSTATPCTNQEVEWCSPESTKCENIVMPFAPTHACSPQPLRRFR